MTKPLTCWLSLCFLCGQASAQLDESQQREYLKALNGVESLSELIKEIRGSSPPAPEVIAIAVVLANTHEVSIHQMRGATGNKVYLHKDGKREAVYDAAGKLVQDGVNDGSYNYFHPRREAARHFTFDILPWMTWGNSAEDPTTPKERI